MLPDAQQFGDCSTQYLRDLVTATEMSQIEIASRLDISPRAIRYYLHGNRPIRYLVQLGLYSILEYQMADLPVDARGDKLDHLRRIIEKYAPEGEK